jgi:thymidine kinase
MMYLQNVTPQEIRNGQGMLCAIAGGMKGYKTGLFLQFFDRSSFAGITSQIFKPHIDDRAEVQGEFPSHYYVSRSGLAMPATKVDAKGNLDDFLQQLDPSVEAYGMGELHLFSESVKLAEYLIHLKEVEKKFVVVEGLDRDFKGAPFPGMSLIMAHATFVDKCYGTCDKDACDERAEYSQRIVDGKPAPYDDDVIFVGASEAYEVRCGPHHEVPGKPTLESIFKSQG